MSARRKFIVLSNGLRDRLGHYLETSLAVAEAAEREGFHPVLATHVECRRDDLPEWLETHSLFRTDHWVNEPPAIVPAAEKRFDAFCSKTLRFCERTTRLARRGAYLVSPPFFYDVGKRLAYYCVPRVAQPAEFARVAAKLRRVACRLRYGANAPLLEQAAALPELSRALALPASPPRLAEAARRLLPEGLGRELEYALIFHQDLERLLEVTGIGPSDHVWMGTTHAREVLAVHWVCERLGPWSPTFHLEFRHTLFEFDLNLNLPVETWLTRMQRSLLRLHAEWGAMERMRFYTDSPVLAADFESVVDLPFSVLPLPFRAHLIARPERHADDPITIAYLGGPRDEKGFPWLPDLIEALRDEYLIPGKARFMIQANVSQPQYNPQTTPALHRLQRQEKFGVELVGRRGPLSPEDYYKLVSQADVVLLPYCRGAYRARTSGALGEALAAGAAVVVPEETWLADELPPGCGETFQNFGGFVAAVKKVLDDFESYARAAQRYQPLWRERHSPDALVAALVGGPTASSLKVAA
jgi:glycosyltransferase involved in cell wall biosynthesis